MNTEREIRPLQYFSVHRAVKTLSPSKLSSQKQQKNVVLRIFSQYKPYKNNCIPKSFAILSTHSNEISSSSAFPRIWSYKSVVSFNLKYSEFRQLCRQHRSSLLGP